MSLKGKMKAIAMAQQAAIQNVGRHDPEAGPRPSLDVSLKAILAGQQYNTTPEQLYHDLGVNFYATTLQELLTRDEDTRWLAPVFIRDAIESGVRLAPIYPSLIAASEPVPQPAVTLPKLELSEASPRVAAEGASIEMGTVSYGDKTVKLVKRARGLAITYEAVQFMSLNLLSIFLRDLGIRLGSSLSTLAVTALLNGDQADGSESAAVIGVESTSNKLAYLDIVRVWVRLALLGRQPTTILADEAGVNKLLNMDEFKKRYQGSPDKTLNLRTPLPSEQDLFAHGSMPAGKFLFLCRDSALVQLIAQPLLIEYDKIISRQIQEAVASVITGFATLLRDSRVVVNEAVAFSGNGFPSWMDPAA
jgi:hypothetical protein